MFFITKYMNEEGKIVKGFYGNNRTALQVFSENGERRMVATVNVVAEHVEKDEVIIKNWSENEGVLDSLIENNVISVPIRTVPVGYCVGHVCKLKPEAEWINNEI